MENIKKTLNTASSHRLFPVRVILADDHQFVLETLELLTNGISHLEVVKTCKEGSEVLSFLRENTADLVIADFRMEGMDGISMARNIQQFYPNVKVMMLTMSDEIDSLRQAVQAGVVGYVLKKVGIEELKEAIEIVISGGKYFDQENLYRLLQQPISGEPLLTNRELDIIRLIAQEATTSEMADRLFISEKTVETHRRNIINKLGVKNSVGVVMYAVKRGLV
ncbi:response regulator transcription factor [Runella sp. MFBS21]|uniref:response regulator n=1 Tax=Runella sp. MFBS21 TaxID=3034018 RepID=UPI0023FA0954|nr:response regulator transcription factor [Runella sp. MFBS21]MDF7816830.1 response regulator transcription factor [Runella sp. MFBS21]